MVVPRCRLSTTTLTTLGSSVEQTLAIQFGKEAPWIAVKQHFTRQRDGHNCGPIACLKIMEVYGYIEKGHVETIS